jgi:hypothetical protein
METAVPATCRGTWARASRTVRYLAISGRYAGTPYSASPLLAFVTRVSQLRRPGICFAQHRRPLANLAPMMVPR